MGGGGQGLAAVERQAPAENAPQSGMSTVVPGGIGGAHPGRSSCVRNAVTLSGSEPRFGKPTVRRAQLPGGNRMTEKRMPVAERQRETATRMPVLQLAGGG
jgi:hypothetical protein